MFGLRGFSAAQEPAPPAKGPEQNQTTQPAQTRSARPWIIATREVPPFAMRSQAGEWSGIAIELWQTVADELRIDYEYRETGIDEMIDGLANGRFDAGVAALTMTAEREARIDFSHPFYNAGLGIAVPAQSNRWVGVARRIFTWEFASAVAALLVLLLVVGVIVWVFERRRNADQFGGGTIRGIGSSFWWSAVTMTTVGYGDKAPATFGGRVVGLVWMFASIIVISSMTAAIASALTVSELSSSIQGPGDLPGLAVATVTGTTGHTYLQQNRIRAREYESPQQAIQAVADGEADAAVYDAPILRYLVNREMHVRIRVLEAVFEPGNYAIGLPPKCPDRERINQIILRETTAPQWRDRLYEYIGG